MWQESTWSDISTKKYIEKIQGFRMWLVQGYLETGGWREVKSN